MAVSIPPASQRVFNGSINHPDLYLWDTWSYVDADTIHLYCLGLSRTKSDGSELKDEERNDFPFHVRHFVSTDDGKTWIDKGCFQQPGNAASGHDERNVWSGSIEPIADGQKLVGYTGIYEIGDDRNFLQNIALARSSDGFQVDWLDDNPLCCPVRDREMILEQGYYLDVPEKLGHNNGEEGGPVMSWRDPFIFIDDNRQIHLFWSAKSDPKHGVVAHALVEETSNGYRLKKLYPPVSLPDGRNFTQAEVPKIYYDKNSCVYYLVIASCNRIYEGQSDEEAEKAIRLYKSDSLRGPWAGATEKGSAISGAGGLFGMTVLKTDFEHNRLLCMAPYTNAAGPELACTFRAPFYLDLSTGIVVE